MPKPLLVRKEVRTHLVAATAGSSAQPPCRRGGLGGGPFNREETCYSQVQSRQSQVNWDNRSTHTNVTLYQTVDREIVFKELFIHKTKGRQILQDRFLGVPVSKRHITLISVLASFRSVCFWLVQDTQYTSRLIHRGCILLAKYGSPGIRLLLLPTFQWELSHATCFLGYKSACFRHVVLDEELFLKSICFCPLPRTGG